MSRDPSVVARPVDRSLRGDVAALYLAQGAMLVLPLATLPYLARVLGPSAWGAVVISQSFATWLALLVDFGLTITATRELSQARDDASRIPSLVAGVQAARVLLAVVACLIAAPLAWIVPVFREQPVLLVLACAAAVAQGLYPFWYFQGIGQVRSAVYADVCLRVVGAGGIFLFVRSPADAPIVLALHALTQFVATAVTTRRMRRDVPRCRVSGGEVRATLRRAVPMVTFRVSAGLYTTINAFLLGLFVPSSMVAAYGAAERIARAGLAALDPLAQAVFPRLSYWVARDRRTADRLNARFAPVAIAMGAAIATVIAAAAAPIVTLLLGPGYEEAIPLLRMLALVVPLVAVSNVLGIQWMLPRGLDRSFATIVAAAAAMHLGLASVLAARLGPAGMALSAIVTEAGVALAMALVVWRVVRRAGGAAAGALSPAP